MEGEGRTELLLSHARLLADAAQLRGAEGLSDGLARLDGACVEGGGGCAGGVFVRGRGAHLGGDVGWEVRGGVC